MESRLNTTSTSPCVLVVDDDPSILSQLRLALSREFEVLTAGDSDTAWRVAQREHPELVTLDLALDDNDPETGFRLLEQLVRFDPFMKVVLVTGNDHESNALRSVEQGAADFFAKPVDAAELTVLLRRVLARGRLERQCAATLQQLGDDLRLGSILGQSSSMQLLFRRIERVAAVDVAVLILGESGTGKELVAREIRRLSHRAGKPFVSINCGAIPEQLLESELFGHEKGAFTGAHARRAGRLEMAAGGIVFLDEIGEIAPFLQVKLLRFLQEHEVERVGGREVIHLDLRVLAATSRNLAEEVRQGRFREDLYYRLSVVNLQLPPLRDRSDDIPMLSQFFLDRFAAEFGRGALTFTSNARLALRNWRWPGNVRELEHKVQKAVLMSTGRQIDVADLELEEAMPRGCIPLREARDEAERCTIIRALQETGGNVSKAARVLGISRPSLYELLEKQNIDTRTYKTRTVNGSPPRGE